MLELGNQPGRVLGVGWMQRASGDRLVDLLHEKIGEGLRGPGDLRWVAVWSRKCSEVMKLGPLPGTSNAWTVAVEVVAQSLDRVRKLSVPPAGRQHSSRR